MKLLFGILITAFLLVTSFGADKNVLENGKFDSKYSWKMKKGEFLKDGKGNQYIRLKNYRRYNTLSQKVSLKPGRYDFSFKIRGNSSATVRVMALGSRSPYNSFKDYEKVSASDISAKSWNEIKGTVEFSTKKHKYFLIALYGFREDYKNPNYFIEIDDVVLTKGN